MTRVLVLGGSGMLGSMVVDELSADPSLKVTATARDAGRVDTCRHRFGRVDWRVFVPGHGEEAIVDGHEWVVNAIGLTKPFISDTHPEQIAAALDVNALFPHRLGLAAGSRGARVLQIATDCVFSGATGNYRERDPHDALDVYGKTKSLGETFLPAVHHLRCSIVGPEQGTRKFLIEWFRGQPRGAEVSGFTNHNWNGVTTLHFARICRGIIAGGLTLGHLQHVVPAGTITKAQMLREFATAYDRSDIVIRDIEAKAHIDRTLATDTPEMNIALWRAAGYDRLPTVAEMIAELGQSATGSHSGADRRR